jgi:uncharacterized repeat protein (TIGR03803 family)
MDKEGKLYGTSQGAGDGGYGVVYKLTPRSGTWQLDVLYSFHSESDGIIPAGGVVLDSKGNLYGATVEGGHYVNFGALFRVRHEGKTWKESVVFSFDGWDGYGPQPGLIWGVDGQLIGATEVGGSNGGAGVVYALRP